MVPTFFNTRNAMTFRWEKESERDNWSFVILRVNTDIVEEHICYVSDKTVAYNDAKPIILTEESLKEIEINKTLEIRSFYDDEIKKQRAGAELIIYENVIDTGFIDSIIAKEKDTKYVQNLLQETKQYKELLIDKTKEYFFHRE
jgi:uncharacterized protein (UPF0276 family)